MDKEEIISMAIEAKLPHYWQSGDEIVYFERIEHFAKLVAEKEREACATVCEEQYDYYGYDHVFAKAIRARGQQ